MTLDTAFFYFCALLVLGGGVMTITRRNAVHAAISLIFTLIGVSGLYLLTQAEFLFAVQIVLYVGGIMVLFLFVIMLVNLDLAAREKKYAAQWPAAAACLLAIGGEAAYFLVRGLRMPGLAAPSTDPRPQGNVEGIADALFGRYLLPFEIASVLLLAAMVGAVVMAKRRV